MAFDDDACKSPAHGKCQPGIVQASHGDHGDDGPDSDQGDGPVLSRNAPACKVEAYQQGCDVGAGGNADPAKLNAESELGNAEGLKGKALIDKDQACQQAQHDEDRKPRSLVMPCKDPQAVEQGTGHKGPAH